MHILPICPRPYEQEAARSWLGRVGDIYGLNAERLVGILGLVPFQPGSRCRLTRPVETALDAHGLDTLAVAAQLPSTRLAEMRPGPVAWTLTQSTECSVCAQCLDEDLRQNDIHSCKHFGDRPGEYSAHSMRSDWFEVP